MFLTPSKSIVTLMRRDRESYEVRLWSPRRWSVVLVLGGVSVLLGSFWAFIVLSPLLDGDAGPGWAGWRTAVPPILALAHLTYQSRGDLLVETISVRDGALVLRRDYLILRTTESFSFEEVEGLRAGNRTVEFEALGKSATSGAGYARRPPRP